MTSPRLFVTAAAAAALAAGAASAQPSPRVPIDAKGFRIHQAMMAAHAARSAAAARPTVRPTRTDPRPLPADQQVLITMTLPPGTAPAAVAFRGPDGELRTFPVEGGAAELAGRVIVVRPGQAVTIRVTPQGTLVDRQ